MASGIRTGMMVPFNKILLQSIAAFGKSDLFSQELKFSYRRGWKKKALYSAQKSEKI